MVRGALNQLREEKKKTRPWKRLRTATVYPFRILEDTIVIGRAPVSAPPEPDLNNGGACGVAAQKAGATQLNQYGRHAATTMLGGEQPHLPNRPAAACRY